MRTIIIIPAYNEAQNLPNLISEIIDMGYEYLIINDCSSDETVKLCKKNHFNYLDLPINLGIAGVTMAGFKYAYDNDYDAAIVIDGDGQHPPKYIKPLLDKMNEGYDYVLGSRFIDEKKPFNMRMLGSRLLSLLIKIKTGKTITDPTSGMRALGKKTVCDFAEHMNYIAEPDALVHVLRSKYRFAEVAVKMEERSKGESYFKNPYKSVKYMVQEIISILFIQW